MSEPTPDLAALADSVREIEQHVAEAGWDGPVRVFALVRTQEMLRTEPGLAAQLHLGYGTVKTHVSRLLTKLDFRDRAQLVMYAYESGLAVPGRT